MLPPRLPPPPTFPITHLPSPSSETCRLNPHPLRKGVPPSDTSWETQEGPSLSELLGAGRWGGWSPGHQAPGAVPGADLRPRLLLSQPGSPPPEGGRPSVLASHSGLSRPLTSSSSHLRPSLHCATLATSHRCLGQCHTVWKTRK